MADTVKVRLLATHDELRRCEDIQRRTWNMRDLEIVPMHTLIAFAMHGGMVLGAEVSGELVGFLFGYPGLLDAGSDRAAALGSRVFHASQMLGVLPDYQNLGIGLALKQEQRRLVLADGVRLATWTFDPLLSRNAYFNLVRLGAIARHYIRNLYDELPGINAGLPTDRLEVEWWLASAHVEERLAGAPIPAAGVGPAANTTARRPDGSRAPVDWLGLPGTGRFRVEIPGDIDAIKAADMGLARAWRLHIREALEAAFAAGFGIVGCVTEPEEGQRRSFYILADDINLSEMARGSA
jgi:predicted GNAT superfamily acetyltransferase